MSKVLEYKIKFDNLQFKTGMEANVKHTKHLDSAFSGLKDKLTELAGIYVSFEFLKDSVKEFVESETAADNLAQAVGKNGGLSSDFEELKAQAEKLQSIGIFNVKQTEEAQSMAETFGITGGKIKELMPIIEDFAARKHITPVEAMAEVLKSTTGKLGSDLKEAGIQIDKTASKSEKLASVAKQLQSKFADANEEIASTTAAGQIANMSNQFEDLKFQIGEELLKAFSKLRPYILSAIDGFKNLFNWVSKNWEVIKAVAAPILAVALAIGAVSAATSIWNAALTVLNIVLDANPIVLIVLAIIGLGVAIYECYQHFEGFRKAVAVGWEVIKQGAVVIWDYLVAPFKAAWHIILAVKEAVSGNWTEAKAEWAQVAGGYIDTAKDIANGISEVKKAYNADYSAVKEPGADLGKKTSPFTGKKTNTLVGETPEKKEVAREAITINITKLVETLEVHSANLKEGAQEIKEIVAQVLQEAVYSAKYAGH